MRRSLLLLLFGIGLLQAQTPTEGTDPGDQSTVSGTVSLDDGTPAPSGIVSFYRTDPPPDPGAGSFVQHAPVTPKGTYVVQLPPGVYRVCTQVWEVPGLDPCLWSEQAPTLTIPAQNTALPFPVKLLKGQFLHVRLDDSKGQVLAHGKAHPEHNLRIGVGTPVGFVDPGELLATDASGVTYRAIYPLGQTPVLFVQHHGIGLADGAGKALAAEDWSNVSDRFSPVMHAHADAQHPDLTLSITGALP